MTQSTMGSINTISSLNTELNPPYRLLLSPVPCNVDPRVLRMVSAPQLGYMDPVLLTILKETAQMLRAVFQLEHVLPQSGFMPTVGVALAAADAVYQSRR